MTSFPNLSQLNDIQIIKLITQEGQTELFSVLYKKYYNRVLGKCITMCKNKEDAKDTTQEIFLKVFNTLSSFEERSLFSTWLYRITFNECLNFLRKKKNKKAYSLNSDRQYIDVSDELFNIKIAKDQMIDNVFQLIPLMKEHEQKILLLKYQQNYSLKQIEATLNIKESAIKMRLMRVRKKLLRLYNQKHSNLNSVATA